MTPSLASSWRRTALDPRNSFHVDVTLLGGMLEAKTGYSASGWSGTICFQGDFIRELSQTATARATVKGVRGRRTEPTAPVGRSRWCPRIASAIARSGYHRTPAVGRYRTSQTGVRYTRCPSRGYGTSATRGPVQVWGMKAPAPPMPASGPPAPNGPFTWEGGMNAPAPPMPTAGVPAVVAGPSLVLAAMVATVSVVAAMIMRMRAGFMCSLLGGLRWSTACMGETVGFTLVMLPTLHCVPAEGLQRG